MKDILESSAFNQLIGISLLNNWALDVLFLYTYLESC